MNTRRIDLWVGRGAAVVGLAYVLLASLRSTAVGSADRRTKRTATATVVRCPERSRMRGATIVAATCLVAIMAALFVTIHAIEDGADAWALPLVSVIP